MLFYSKKTASEIQRQSISNPQNWPHVSSKIEAIAECGSPSKRQKEILMNSPRKGSDQQHKISMEVFENEELTNAGTYSQISNRGIGSRNPSKNSMGDRRTFKRNKTFFENTTINLQEEEELRLPRKGSKEKKH